MKIDEVVVGGIEVTVKEVCEYSVTVEVKGSPVSVTVQSVGAQGAPGLGAATVVGETDEDCIITNEDFLFADSAIEIRVGLRDPAAPPRPTTVINSGSADVVVYVVTGANIFDDPEFVVKPGNSFTFVARGGRYYVV